MNAPTGGPNGRDFGRRPACVLGCLCAVLYYLAAAPANADTELRVTGTLTIEASASLRRGACDVRARVLDDAGQPVAAEQLQIRPLSTPAGSNVHECGPRPSALSANAAGAYLATTSDAGTVCVHFEGVPEHAEFELTFSDPNGLYAAASKRVVADAATRSVEMAFAPGQTVFALERDTQILSLATRPEPRLATDENVQSIEVLLNVAHEGRPAEKLASALVEVGGNTEFRVPSRALGEPGPLEISAEFAGSGSTRAARAVLHVTSTAQARVSLAEALAPSHPESGVRVRVRVSSVAGAVPSGTVEARSGGISLGSGRVSEGTAELYVQLEEAAAKARPLELRYVADTPWWLPGAPLSVAVPILPPSPWRRIAWVAAALALGAWLLVGWQRPRRLERAAHARAERDSARAPIDVLELGDARDGWRGRVLDAHDGSPIANALVLVRLPSFDESGVQHTARTDEDGAFTLEGSAGPGAALTVRAPFHSPLAAPMPPPGTLLLSLTSRRRTLLTRFVDWATREGGWERRGEVTPGEVARRTDRTEVAGWAGAVDEAAFGPEPLSESKEQTVLAREPPHHRKPS